MSEPPIRDRVWLHVLLLALTFVTTTVMGRLHYEGFLQDFSPRPLLFVTSWDLWLGGLWYSVPLLAILGAHEMGHYLTCRRYGVNASLPYFLPLPPPIAMSGTMGAFIRIRGHITSKPVLFDMAAAGPFAGFVVAVPVLFWGTYLSRVVRLPAELAGAHPIGLVPLLKHLVSGSPLGEVGLELGEPALFQAFSYLLFGDIADGWSLNLHPMAMAAWFGLLVTAMNLIPVGQLDGGHISYAVFGRRAGRITIGALVAIAGLTVFAASWAFWALLLLVLLRLFGLHHPPAWDEDVPLDRTRVVLAVLALLVFLACFTPYPIRPLVQAR